MSNPISVYARRPTTPIGQTPIQEQTPPKRKRNIWAIVAIILIVVIVILIAILIWLWLTRSSSTTTIGKGSKCTTDRNCNAGLVCDIRTRTCEMPLGGNCATQTDCSMGTFCSGGKCLSDFDGYCASTNDCLQPYTCKNNACVPPTCSTSADCRDPSTQICVNQDVPDIITGIGKQCVFKPQQSCITNDQCAGQVSPLHETCQITTAGNFCASFGGEPCSGDKDCLSGSCVAGICSCSSTAGCTLAKPNCIASVCTAI